MISLTCFTWEAQARFTPYDLSDTSWCRGTPYETDGSVIYGNEVQVVGPATASRASIKQLSKAVGAYRIVGVTNTHTLRVASD